MLYAEYSLGGNTVAGVGRSEALTWSFTLLITCLLGVGIGLSLGYAIFNPPEGMLKVASTPDTPSPADQPTEPEDAQDTPPASPPQASPEDEAPPRAPADEIEKVTDTAQQDERKSNLASPESMARYENPDGKDVWAARHLFIAVNGQWLAEGTKAFLRELRPGGVVLRSVNLQNRTQTLELVKEIKLAGGLGGGLGNLPLIAVQEEIGPLNRLGLTDAPSARELGRSGDDDAARELGENFARACVERGIGVTFSPVLDVYEFGTVDPGFESRSFGTDQTVVARIGLAMVDGMRQGGVISAVKHFPGYGASTYGSDGTLVVLNKDFNGLAKVMYPFNEAVRRNVQGIVVGYMAVPALDKASPRRPAALSPVLVTDLLRNRWGFNGVILADDVMSNGITFSRPLERSAVEALAAGCDAIILLDANPQRIRLVRDAIVQAVRNGELSREALQRSKERLERWQDLLNKTPPGPGNSRLQRMTKSAPTAIEQPSDPALAQAPSPAVVEIPPPATVAVDRSETKPSEEPDKLIVTKLPESTPEESTPQVPATPLRKDVSPVEVSTDDAPLLPNQKSDVEVVEITSAPPESSVSAANASGLRTEDRPSPTQVTSKDIAPVPQEDLADRPKEVLEVKVGETILTARTQAFSAAIDSGEIKHTVREDELLSHIASIYGVSAADIVRWNDLSHARLAVGSKLIIRFGPEPAAEVEPEQDTPAKPDAGSSRAELSAAAYKIVHVVKQGQNLNTLAKQYTVSTDNLKLWNGLDKETLEAGQKITVFLGSPRNASDSSPELKIVDYKVQVGDTLSNIGRRFGTTPQLLLQMNGLKDPNHIWVGQKLKLPVAI